MSILSSAKGEKGPSLPTGVH